MHPSIREDLNLRELALSEARNAVGPEEPLSIWLQQEHLTQQEYDLVAKNSVYRGYVNAYKAELKESGFSFSAKARILAEDLLADIYHMAKDSDTPAAMRVKTLENLVEWGRLAPKQTATEAAGAGFSVTINMGPSTGPQSVTVSQTAPLKAVEMADIVDIHEATTRIDLLEPVSDETELHYLGEDLETQPSWAAHPY